ncbi:MAG: hypothetical protein KKB38_20825 [Gammaproteobacteria bacterium]|nr:hypothetical protein [Gammaproteobacteria bacterium]
MRTRDAVLVYQETQSSDASTKTIDLDLVDPVSALAFEFQATNGTTFNQNNPLYECVTKIEIVDGADVLASLEAKEVQAFQWYKTSKEPTLRHDETASSDHIEGFMLLFGRYLWDTEFAMDFTRFRNPQLKITWNLAAIKAVSATEAYATGTFKISVVAKVMEGGVSPSQYLMQKTTDTWTSGTSGDRRKELPVDYPYRLIVLSAYVSGNDVRENITKIKMSCDTDKFVPLERYTQPFNEEMAQLFGRCRFWKRAFATNNDSIWLPVNQEPQIKVIKAGDAGLRGYDVGLNYCWSGIANIYVADTSGGAYGTDSRIDLEVSGHGIHSTVPIPFGDLSKPESWFDPTVYKKVELVLTEAAAADCRIALEQVRPLP